MNAKPEKSISIVGCGWLGLPVGAALSAKGFRVKGSTTDCNKLDDLELAGISPYLLVLDPGLNCDQPDELFSTDVLVINIPPGRRRDDVETRHPQQIRTLIECIEQYRIPFVVFVSSTSVYPDTGREVREEDAGNPPTASGRALLEAEGLLTSNPAFQTTIVRFGGLIGGDRNPARFLAGKTNVTEPRAPVNLIHRDDCIRILFTLIERDIRGEVLNACSDRHPTRKEFYTREAEKLRLPPPTFDKSPGGPGKIVTSEKLKRLLRYEFLYPDPSQAFDTIQPEPMTT